MKGSSQKRYEDDTEEEVIKHKTGRGEFGRKRLSIDTGTQEELMEELIDFVKINEFDLETEFLEHSGKYIQIAVHLRNAKAKAGDAKVNYNLAKSSEILAIRSKAKGSRITVDEVKALAEESDSVVLKYRKLVKAEADLVLWESIKEAMYQRSYMLTSLATLHEGSREAVVKDYNNSSRTKLLERVQRKSKHSDVSED